MFFTLTCNARLPTRVPYPWGYGAGVVQFLFPQVDLWYCHCVSNQPQQFRGINACFFYSSNLFGMMWIRYLMGVCENVSISFWILEVYGSFHSHGDDDRWENYPTQLGQQWLQYGIFIQFLGGSFCTNLSLQYVNPNICILRVMFGEKGGLVVGGLPKMHVVCSLRCVRQLHLGGQCVHGSSHESKEFFGLRSLVLLALTCAKHLAAGWASNVFASMCVALLCRLEWRSFMCMFVQHNNWWKHVSIWQYMHRSHVGDMLSLGRVVFFQQSHVISLQFSFWIKQELMEDLKGDNHIIQVSQTTLLGQFHVYFMLLGILVYISYTLSITMGQESFNHHKCIYGNHSILHYLPMQHQETIILIHLSLFTLFQFI